MSSLNKHRKNEQDAFERTLFSMALGKSYDENAVKQAKAVLEDLRIRVDSALKAYDELLQGKQCNHFHLQEAALLTVLNA